MENIRSIEEKLDWILDAVKSGKFKTGFSEDNRIIKGLFQTNDLSFNDTTLDYRHEYDQLLGLLISEGYIEEDGARSIYTLTIKGKLFDGFKNAKKRRVWDDRFKRASTFLISIATIFAIVIGPMEIYEKATNKSEQYKEQLERISQEQSKIQETLSNLSLQESEEKVENQKTPSSSKVFSSDADTTQASNTVK